MNLQRLKQAEAEFLQRYPGGFSDPELTKTIAKKHPVAKLADQTKELLSRKAFAQQAAALDGVTKIVTRSSMISMFEKPKFRDYVKGMSRDDRAMLSQGFKTLLHGKQEKGFNQVLDILAEGKLAKWSLMTVCMFHYRPEKDVFVKPTTTKNAISFFELEGLEYKPRPSWSFYEQYRTAIDRMKAEVHPSLAPNNAAFTGFLMMSMGEGNPR